MYYLNIVTDFLIEIVGTKTLNSKLVIYLLKFINITVLLTNFKQFSL